MKPNPNRNINSPAKHDNTRKSNNQNIIVISLKDRVNNKSWQNTLHYPFESILKRLLSIKKGELREKV